MVLEPVLIFICILLILGIGYFIYTRFQFLQMNIESLSTELDMVQQSLDKTYKFLDKINQSLEASSKNIAESVEELLKVKLDYFFSEAYKVEQADNWLNEADNEEDKLNQLTLLEQGAKRYPFHKEIHSKLFEMYFKTLENESTLLRRKAILDKMIPISQDYRDNAFISHFDHANDLFRKTEEGARQLLDDLNQYKIDLVEERLEELSKALNELDSNLNESENDSDSIETLIQHFKELDDSIDKKLISQKESFSNVYRDISERFVALLRKASTEKEKEKRKEYNLRKLNELEEVSNRLKVHADNNAAFTDEMIRDYTKSIFIDHPELASEKLLQYAQSIFNELFTNSSRRQRKLMTEIIINLEYE